ncbi:MAG: BamA/TamA family outer membrane protein [Candidatus Cloacimonetes bacterium]|nr:BamA/TamA family outer membrane protein [Candidatus Cloacimonadota bacterium]
MKDSLIKKSLLIVLLSFLLIIPLLSYTFGKNKVQVEKLEWSVMQTIHFDIYFPKGADEFGQTVALMAEEAYYYLQDAFQTPLYTRIPLIFYESHREFQVTNIIYQLLSEGVGGFTESLHNRVVIPYDGSYKKLEETLIHELTHAYINAMDSDFTASRFFNLPRMTFPFWFQEGLPEYLAIGGEDNYNNMFIMDMVFNSYLYQLEIVGGYYAYRLGESFLTYIDETYGREYVMRYFFATRTAGSIDNATQRVFGMTFESLQNRWRNHLLRKYTPYLQTHTVPYEKYERRTDHNKDGSYFNFAPRFSPDGRNYLYFSNRNQRMSIWRGYPIDIFEEQLILRGETTGRFEQFHFLRNNISWFPDSRRFSFVAKTKAGDVIYIADVTTGKVLEAHEMYDFDAIYEIDICREGNRIVFSGQKEMRNNIYYMDIQTREITQITTDQYYDHQPRWSPDGTKIVFSSERTISPEHKYEHIFNRLTDQIYYYDLNEEKFYQVTTDEFSNHSPAWDSTGTKILFISEEYDVNNFHIIDLENGKRAHVTRTLNGVFSGDLNYNDSHLIFSAFYNNGWDIYFANQPLANLDYQDYGFPQEVELIDDFTERFSLYRFKFYGRRDEEGRRSNREYDIERTETSFFRVRRDITLDKRPEEIKVPAIEPYRVRFYLDRLWGGAAYSSTYGTYATLQLGLSDVMGDHTIGIQLGIAGKIKDSDFIFTYLYLPRRIDIGFGGFYLTDDILYYYPVPNVYINVRENDVGIYTLFRYPLNRFWRLDFENLLYSRTELYEIWNPYVGVWEEIGTDKDLIYSPQIRIVHDNILWGVTGPLSGWRAYLALNRSFATDYHNYFTAHTDLRSYTLFAKRYSLAARLFAGFSNGDRPQSFRLDGYHGIRGLTEEQRGHKKAVSTLELRFPFIDQLRMAFPLPMTLYQLRGSVYTDFGAVWDNHKDFKGASDGRLKDLVLGFGLGPRVNLGFFVLKFDVAWSTDLENTSKPTYYISINEEF